MAFTEIVLLACVLLGMVLLQHSFILFIIVAYVFKNRHASSKHSRAVVSWVIGWVDPGVSVWMGFWSGRPLQSNLRTTGPASSAEHTSEPKLKGRGTDGDTQAEKGQGTPATDQYEDSTKDFVPFSFRNN